MRKKLQIGKAGETQARHTHSVAAALEDVIAILLDVISEQEKVLQYSQIRTENALQVARKCREGPHAYDENSTNVKTQARTILKKR